VRINAFSDICLRAVVLLAAAPQAELLTSQVISDSVGTPYNHMSKAIIRLRELGLVEVVRGRSGGVRISPEGRRATVGWLLRRLDTRTDVADCETPNGACPLIVNCGLRSVLLRAREAFYSELDDVVISELSHDPRVGQVFMTLSTRGSA
jgi:Rrf2 family nitric oxide-sensitive transcriptional repressor